jgi:hypothetical protein
MQVACDQQAHWYSTLSTTQILPMKLDASHNHISSSTLGLYEAPQYSQAWHVLPQGKHLCSYRHCSIMDVWLLALIVVSLSTGALEECMSQGDTLARDGPGRPPKL